MPEQNVDMITISVKGFLDIIQHYTRRSTITCISKDCKYNTPTGSGCALTDVLLRNGICRYHDTSPKQFDRQDIDRSNFLGATK